MMIKELFKAPVKRDIHEFDLLKKDLNDDTWNTLYSVGTPVTTFEHVAESNGAKEILVKVSVPCTQAEWDKLNRQLGKLGIDYIDTAK